MEGIPPTYCCIELRGLNCDGSVHEAILRRSANALKWTAAIAFSFGQILAFVDKSSSSKTAGEAILIRSEIRGAHEWLVLKRSVTQTNQDSRQVNFLLQLA